MVSILQQLIACTVLTSSLVLGQNAPPSFPPVRGGANFNCPQENGAFEAPGECARFYQCDGGVATLMSCQPQFIFNPQLRYCDWPSSAANRNCPAAYAGIDPQLSQICQTNPGDVSQAFLAGHPEICNAFFTCSTGFLHGVCTFCGEGMYFNQEARGCRDYLSQGLDVAAVCQGRQFIQHVDQEVKRLDSTCRRLPSPNALQVLHDLIRGGRGQRTTPPFVRSG